MRITIDASSLLLPSAGIKTYTWHWLRHLAQVGEGHDIRAFPYLPGVGRLEHSRSVLPRWRTLPRIALLLGVNYSNTLLDSILAGTDVFHATNQVRLLPRRAQVTATIHDFTCWIMPELHTEANVRADKLFAERVLERASGLIAVSENTRRDAIRILRVPPEKIEVIPSGVGDQYYDATPTKRARPYVLYVGAIEPRKNLETLLDAWEQMPASLRAEFDLVIAGLPAWAPETTMARIRTIAHYLGYVSQASLPGLFAGATAFVYPSLYEGFGFPILEAMAAGVPVITSGVSALPDTAGDAAVLVDPRSAGEISSAIVRLLLSESSRKDLASRGRLRARCFRWETCATRSLEFFRRVSGQ